jgi:hypothetical protein
MQIMVTLGGIALMVVLGAMPVSAQTSVDAGVEVHSGGTSVGGHVSTGSPPPTVIVREPVREVIVVERRQMPRGRAKGWWRRQGYREVRVYSDGDSYYGRRIERRPGLREVVIYEREGRYYRWDEGDDGDRGRGREHEHEHEHKDRHDD